MFVTDRPLYRGDFQFESFASLIDYIESVDEKKLSGVVSLIQWAQNRLPRCLDSIRQIMASYKQAGNYDWKRSLQVKQLISLSHRYRVWNCP